MTIHVKDEKIANYIFYSAVALRSYKLANYIIKHDKRITYESKEVLEFVKDKYLLNWDFKDLLYEIDVKQETMDIFKIIAKRPEFYIDHKINEYEYKTDFSNILFVEDEKTVDKVMDIIIKNRMRFPLQSLHYYFEKVVINKLSIIQDNLVKALDAFFATKRCRKNITYLFNMNLQWQYYVHHISMSYKTLQALNRPNSKRMEKLKIKIFRHYNLYLLSYLDEYLLWDLNRIIISYIVGFEPYN